MHSGTIDNIFIQSISRLGAGWTQEQLTISSSRVHPGWMQNAWTQEQLTIPSSSRAGCRRTIFIQDACRQLFRQNADASTTVEDIHAGLLGQWIIFMKDAMRPGAQDA